MSAVTALALIKASEIPACEIAQQTKTFGSYLAWR